MAEPVRHRQTKGAETDMLSLPPLRHISTLPRAADDRDLNEWLVERFQIVDMLCKDV
jgi:hypothetical protein